MFVTNNIIANNYKTNEALFLLVSAYLIITLPLSLVFSYFKKGFAMFEILSEGNNFLRILCGLFVTAKIAFISIIFSFIFGIIFLAF